MYEKLLEHASKYNVEVYEKPMVKNVKGLYADNIIWINKNYLKTSADKGSILAEELGHYHTTVGDIIDQSKIANQKQELRARTWAYEQTIPISKIIEAHRLNLRNKYELANHLEVTEPFLEAALQRYRDKYGLSVNYDNYTICFDPLGVIEWFDHKNF
ncbi:ImmA/IrrE family metallo-endopeptidase [Oceanobacillus sp. CFH 90083]|uniref:ImmA/IrrE family metallo-endopeptidase n=1 Tax=Oceanobacillus sp. CFH 90083 TaxID=2592336 RepID=UPI00128CCA47|nr:ImmA/IrrE family metallo-endopeptidase [Oceanobacillus sp. CFH 90083]